MSTEFGIRNKDVMPHMLDRLRAMPLLLAAMTEDGLRELDGIPLDQRPVNKSRERAISFVLDHAEPSTPEAIEFVDELRNARHNQ